MSSRGSRSPKLEPRELGFKALAAALEPDQLWTNHLHRGGNVLQVGVGVLLLREVNQWRWRGILGPGHGYCKQTRGTDANRQGAQQVESAI